MVVPDCEPDRIASSLPCELPPLPVHGNWKMSAQPKFRSKFASPIKHTNSVDLFLTFLLVFYIFRRKEGAKASIL